MFLIQFLSFTNLRYLCFSYFSRRTSSNTGLIHLLIQTYDEFGGLVVFCINTCVIFKLLIPLLIFIKNQQKLRPLKNLKIIPYFFKIGNCHKECKCFGRIFMSKCPPFNLSRRVIILLKILLERLQLLWRHVV